MRVGGFDGVEEEAHQGTSLRVLQSIPRGEVAKEAFMIVYNPLILACLEDQKKDCAAL